MGDEDSSLASKCMAFCQALASQGQHFNFSIATGSGFTFSLDTSRSKAVSNQKAKKKSSPSTLRRNAQRREEFLAKKQQECSTRTSVENLAAAKEIRCDQCEYVVASEKGLRQHIRMKHKESSTPTEVLRSLEEFREPLECSSPLLSNTREELCQSCEASFSIGHCCEIYSCDECGKTFDNDDDLSKHEATDHKSCCNHYQCGKKFINCGELIEHERIVHKNRCDHCHLPEQNCRGICVLKIKVSS